MQYKGQGLRASEEEGGGLKQALRKKADAMKAKLLGTKGATCWIPLRHPNFPPTPQNPK